MNKRGAYFFVIDVFIGAAIIFFTLSTILSGETRTSAYENQEHTAREYLSFISTTKLVDFDNEYRLYLDTRGEFDDLQKTILQGITDLYARGDHENARNFTKNFTVNLIRPPLGIEFRLNNTILYSLRNETQDEALSTSVSRQIAFSRVEGELKGPWMVEVSIWS